MIPKISIFPKLIKVDEKLYRSSAPYDPISLYRIKKAGVNQIIDLRNSAYIASPVERFFCKILGIKYIRHKYSHRLDHVPDHDFFQKINETILNNNGITCMHCQKGKRRTSICVAVYEKEHTNKSKFEILQEIMDLGFREILNSNKTKKRIRLQKIYDDFLQKYYP